MLRLFIRLSFVVTMKLQLNNIVFSDMDGGEDMEEYTMFDELDENILKNYWWS